MPRRSVRQRKAGLMLNLARQQGKRADAVKAGASTGFTQQIDAEIAQLKIDLQRVESELAAGARLATRAGDMDRLARLKAKAAGLEASLQGDHDYRLWSDAQRFLGPAAEEAAALAKAAQAGHPSREMAAREAGLALADRIAERAEGLVAAGSDGKDEVWAHRAEVLAGLQGQVAVLRSRLESSGARAQMTAFETMVARSAHLGDWHLRVGEAMLAVLEDAMAGARGSGRSGVAGDGEGRMISDRGLGGSAERGEAFWASLGVPGVATGRGDLRYRGERGWYLTVHKPRVSETKARGGDGGMVAAADRAKRWRKVLDVFMAEASAEGLEACGRAGCGAACLVVLLGGDGKERAYTRFVRGRAVGAREGIEIAMAVGLEAVAGLLGMAAR